MSKTKPISVVIGGRLFVGGLSIDGIDFIFASPEELYRSSLIDPKVTTPRTSFKSFLHLDNACDPPHFIPTVKVDGVDRKVCYEVCSDGIRRVFFLDHDLKPVYTKPSPSGAGYTLLFPPVEAAVSDTSSLDMSISESSSADSDTLGDSAKPEE